MIHLLVVDDHELFRKGIEQILSKTPDIRVKGEAGTGRDALEMARSGEYDLVLLDISLPDRNGLEVLKGLKNDAKDRPVLIVSMHPEEQYAIRAMKSGASGYLTKQTAIDELITAIRRVTQGRKYVSLSLAEKIADGIGVNTERAPHDVLSDREYAVLCRIASGKKTHEIARELFISPKTVTTYKARILKKLDLKGIADLVRYAMEHRLV